MRASRPSRSRFTTNDESCLGACWVDSVIDWPHRCGPIDGACATKPQQPGQCTGGVCPAGQVCRFLESENDPVDNGCRCAPDPPTMCTLTAQCDVGQTCVASAPSWLEDICVFLGG